MYADMTAIAKPTTTKPKINPAVASGVSSEVVD